MSDTTTEPKPDETKPKPDEAKPSDDDSAALSGLDLDEKQQRAFEDLRRENAARRRAERAAQATSDELRGELEKLRVESESEQERMVREAVATAVAETETKFERRLLESEIARRAAGRLRDPEDAISLVPLDELLSIKDEDARAKRLDAVISDLIESKPYLAAEETEPKPRGTLVTQGGRSERPSGSKDGTDPDSWLRSRARR